MVKIDAIAYGFAVTQPSSLMVARGVHIRGARIDCRRQDRAPDRSTILDLVVSAGERPGVEAKAVLIDRMLLWLGN